MAGAYGVLNQVGRLGEALLAFDDMEVVFICGKNTPLRQQIEALLGGHPRVHVFGYVQAIQEIMAFSSCLITKAGGITLAEAIAMSLPVIVFRPLPGQEKENARYLAGKGAVEIVYRPEELAERIRGSLLDHGRLERSKEAIRALHRPCAADAVVRDIWNDIRPPAEETRPHG
ncbi:glycosyltransferase [Paenibacillus sp. P25]|nr:glycosyltransferase [Paenibacillus sp. P25]